LKHAVSTLLTPQDSSAAQLRRMMNAAFNLDEIRGLCFDLGFDFEALDGDDKNTKVIELIKLATRSGKLKELIAQCDKVRPNAGWAPLAQIAATDPAQFASLDLAGDGKRPLLNMSPDRAAKLGFAAGILSLLLFVCGFGGGLLAGNLVELTVNPVQPDRAALDNTVLQLDRERFTASGLRVTHVTMLQAATGGALKPGLKGWIEYSNVAATTLVSDVIGSAPNAPISDVHVQFVETNEGLLNFKFGASRVILTFQLETQNGRLIVKPQRIFLQPLDNRGSRFLWVPVPIAAVQGAIDWAQNRLDNATINVSFDAIRMERNKLRVDFTTK
jgi:hypothetical protein